MKNKIIIFIFALLFVINPTKSQSVVEKDKHLKSLGISFEINKHLKFLGIPMAGNIYSFARYLETKGFKVILMNKDFCVIEGTFLGIPNCELYILNKEKILNKIIIRTPLMMSNKRDSIFYSLRNSLISKYGTPNGLSILGKFTDFHRSAGKISLYNKEKYGYILLVYENI